MLRVSSKKFVKVVVGSLLVLSAASGTVACGGSSSGSDTPVDLASLPPAPDLGIMVRIKATSGEAEAFAGNVETALTTSMTNAGYKLVVSEEAGPDVVANITISATEEKSFFQMQVNGQVQKSYKIAISASFVAAGDASVIDQVATDFSGKDGEVNQNAVDKVLVHLGKTRKLSNYASTTKAKTRQAEDDLWKAANVEGCKKPVDEKACEGVDEYIKKYPTGKYTAEARQALQDGAAAAEKLKEDKVWAAAAVDICLKPTKSYDCKAVEAYIKDYPTGSHVAEGKEAMKKSEAAREGLAKKEAAAKKAENRDECVKNCRREYEGFRFFDTLVGRCVQTECT